MRLWGLLTKHFFQMYCYFGGIDKFDFPFLSNSIIYRNKINGACLRASNQIT
jgi:hypothetical protein